MMNSTQASLSLGLFTLFGFLTACGGSGGQFRGDRFQVSGETYCAEVNEVIDVLLQNHLTKSEADRADLYHSAMMRMYESLLMEIPFSEFAQELQLQFEGLKNEEGRFDPHHLAECSNIEAVKSSVLNAGLQITDEKPFYQIFLSEFTSALDFYSRYTPALGEGSSYTFGIRLDLDLANHFNYVQDEARVLAVADRNQGLKPGDTITHLDIDGILDSDDPRLLKLNFSEEGEGYSLRSLTEQKLGRLLPFVLTSSPRSTLKVGYKSKESPNEIKTLTLNGIEASLHNEGRPLVQAERDGNIIYIRLFEFGLGAAMEISSRIHELKEEWLLETKDQTNENENASENRLGIILDLRFNPGGLAFEYSQVIGLFLPEGEVGRIQKRDMNAETSRLTESPAYSSPVGKIFDEPLIILANNGSASASDLTTQALADTERAFFIGTPTHGKGIQQTTIELGPLSKLGGTVTFTNARYTGIHGRSIQNIGNVPHLEVKDPLIEKLLKDCQTKPEKKCSRQYMKDLPEDLQIPSASFKPLSNPAQATTKTKFTAAQIETAMNEAKAVVPEDGKRLDIQREVAEALLRQLSVSADPVDSE